MVEVDDGQFVKMFTKDIELFFDLSAAAIKTFGLILKITQTEAINRDKTGKKQADFTDADWVSVEERAKAAELAGKKAKPRLAA